MRRNSAASLYLTLTGVVSFANAMMFLISSIYYVQNVGLNPLQLVLVGTVLEAVIFLAEVPTGVVADTYSRRRSIVIGLVLYGLGFGMQGLLAEFWLVLLAQIVWGLGVTFISGADNAWLTDEVGQERVGALFLRGSQVGRVAGLAGLAAGVGLASVNIVMPILLSGLLYLGLSLFVALRMPEDGFKPLPPSERTTWHNLSGTFLEGVRVVQGRPVLWSVLGINFFVGVASEGFDRLYQAHLLTNFAFPGWGLNTFAWFGLLGVAGELLSFLTVWLFRKPIAARMEQPEAVVRLLLLTQPLVILSIFGFALAGNFWLAVAALLFRQSVEAVASPLYNTWVAQNIPSNVRATVLSMSSQVNAIGQIAGGPAVGALGLAFGLRAALAAGGVLLSPALWLYAGVVRRVRREVSPEEIPEVSQV